MTFVVSPTDVIYGIGHFDDVAVAAAYLRNMKENIDTYATWKEEGRVVALGSTSRKIALHSYR